VPSSSPLTSTRNRLTQAAVPQPKRTSTTMTMTFASPGLMPGSGLGRAASTRWMATARAVSQAMRWSSRVVRQILHQKLIAS
jgi:hypothetical protein